MMKWKATKDGLELGDYALDSAKIAEQYDGIYGAIVHVAKKTWINYEPHQFIQAWRKAMVRHGHKIDEVVFENTVRVALNAIMRRQARKIMQDILDPIEDGSVFRVHKFGNPTPQEIAVEEAVDRIMSR